jgi:hypothetical protein
MTKLTDAASPAQGWLPIVLCPTDGARRALILKSGREVVGEFERGEWRVIRDAIKRPGAKLEPLGGVERTAAPIITYVMERLSGDYPTHFRPNDTVHGRPAAALTGDQP